MGTVKPMDSEMVQNPSPTTQYLCPPECLGAGVCQLFFCRPPLPSLQLSSHFTVDSAALSPVFGGHWVQCSAHAEAELTLGHCT